MPLYRRVTYEDRCQIRALLEIQACKAEIARRLGFHKSTIARELKRNSAGFEYRPKPATELSRVRFKACRRRNILQDSLRDRVIEKIKIGWSPEQISGRFADEKVAKISHETIYKFIRANHWIRPEYEQGLRRFKKKGAGRIRQKKMRERNCLPIAERPIVINKRVRFGDWERDTMHAQRKKVIVCVERKSRFMKLARVQEPYCLYLTEQTKKLLRSVKVPVLSITNDNGSEFFDGQCFNVPVYYCDPRSPQQRGTVENSIGLIRQYIPKRAELDRITDEELQQIEDRLNHRPRKILGYKTPYEVLFGTKVALAS